MHLPSLYTEIGDFKQKFDTTTIVCCLSCLSSVGQSLGMSIQKIKTCSGLAIIGNMVGRALTMVAATWPCMRGTKSLVLIVAGEYEIKNAQAMKIMDSFGASGSFTEYYAMDYDADVVLMGHDGPGHIKIAEGKTKVKPLDVYHGKVGQGLSVEMSVKHDPITLLSVVEAETGLKLLVAEGESVAGPILEIGNTNSRYRFDIGAREFVEAWNSHGPVHHCAVGAGNIATKIKKFGKLQGLEVEQVC